MDIAFDIVVAILILEIVLLVGYGRLSYRLYKLEKSNSTLHPLKEDGIDSNGITTSKKDV
jgi:hypothetical protein